MIEVVVHFTTVRVFSAAMKDPTYSLPTMQTKLASDNPSQVSERRPIDLSTDSSDKTIS